MFFNNNVRHFAQRHVICLLQDAAVTSHRIISGGVRLQRRSAVLTGTIRHEHSEYFVITYLLVHLHYPREANSRSAHQHIPSLS
jgi:hypothetical protein